jgi:hypothetical protein
LYGLKKLELITNFLIEVTLTNRILAFLNFNIFSDMSSLKNEILISTLGAIFWPNENTLAAKLKQAIRTAKTSWIKPIFLNLFHF